MAGSGASQKPKDPERLRLHNGSLKDGFPTGHRAGDNSHVRSSPCGSQGEHTEFLIFLSLAADGHLLT
jgi:hypothetical protein